MFLNNNKRIFIKQLEESGSDRNRKSHDDGLTNSGYRIGLSVVCGVKKVIGCSFELKRLGINLNII